MNKIEEALQKRFEKHRVILWYDEKEELREQYDALALEGVYKIEACHNEFEIKHIVEKQKPKEKILLYFPYAKPANEENWLLDMELAHHLFRTDQEAMFLQELGLGYHLKELVAEHIEFFKSKERRQKLKELLGSDDQHEDIRIKMLAVVFNTSYVNLNTFIHAHAAAFTDDNQRPDKDMERFHLTQYYWGKIKHHFNYQSPAPGIHDFLMELFSNNFVLGQGKELSKESALLLSLWKDTIQYRDSFKAVSSLLARELNIEQILDGAGISEIADDDLFRLVDQKIIYDLVNLITGEAVSNEQVNKIIKNRENKFWYYESKPLYDSLLYASNLIYLIRKNAGTEFEHFNEGITQYVNGLYEIDLLYRKFIWSYRKSNQNKILADLAQKVEKIYNNDWLFTFNNNWQKNIDKLSAWQTNISTSQQHFFKQNVKPFIARKQRLFVVISDALRFECGRELNKRFQAENRYESELDFMVSSLPSYTQLGMASLLPHTTLSFQNGSDAVEVDGMSSKGTKARSKILQANSGASATAIKAEDFMKLNSSTDGRDFVKQYQLIYIYHNRIDKTGDDKVSEERVFEAVEEELGFLMDLVKKIANMNGNNIIITSDHGFLYQHGIIEESDFVTSTYKGDVWKENRRFVIGTGLSYDKTVKAFKSTELNIRSDAEVLIPKSINRFKVKGAGTRFVHGGATLQEIVVPLIRVSKKRQDTTSFVEIDIIKTTDRITTNILAVSFLQTGPVSEKVLPRTIRAAIYAEDKERISDMFRYNFDIAEGSDRKREVKHRFQLLSKASGRYKNQRVKLMLEEPIPGTNKWKEYKSFFYTLNITFTNDFDEF